MELTNILEQIEVCKKYGTDICLSPSYLKVGISPGIKLGYEYPLHGLRHPPSMDTTGWFIWSGGYSEDPNFFVPLHVEHLKEWCPEVIKYLGLPPSFRFLLGTNNYEDVWIDEALLEL